MEDKFHTMFNEYITDSIDGFIEIIKNTEEDKLEANIIITALKRLNKKLNNRVNQELLKSLIEDTSEKVVFPPRLCSQDEIYNPLSGRIVKRNGEMGKKLTGKK